MVFSSLIFLFFFLPAVLFCYYIVPQNFIRVRNAVLLLFSLFFYFYGEPRLIGILIFSILMNYLFGLSMRSTYRKPLLILCVIANLSLLGVFKYLNFFISSADSLFGLGIPVPDIVMPIGISFYTFQALSYVIDVYRREVPPQHDPFSLALYVSMFPQLIAGPIVRYHDVNVQLAVRKHSFAQFSEGISRFLFGLSKKVLLSNVFAQIADGVFKYAPSELSVAGAWMGAIGYTLQIYFDFSGYSDMAIGLGKMFGFEFLENFNYPYISKSVTEFWRRWHISLSTCGLTEKIDKLADYQLQLTLSVSLHAPDDETRSRIMPVNRSVGVEKLFAACRRYFEKTGRRISYEYAMIDGVNDADWQADLLARHLKGTPGHVNLIPLNNVEESPLKPSRRVAAFQKRLESHGITATVRRKLGGDIDASCGQLRRKTMQQEHT